MRNSEPSSSCLFILYFFAKTWPTASCCRETSCLENSFKSKTKPTEAAGNGDIFTEYLTLSLREN
jgi:hypothetical protein